MTEKLSAIREKIRALLAKASDAAASEAEALACATRAARLMEEYDLTEAEIGSSQKDEEAVVGQAKTRGKGFHPVQRLTAKAISRLTETKCWTLDKTVLFFAGTAPDVEFAVFLADMLTAVAERGWMQA